MRGELASVRPKSGRKVDAFVSVRLILWAITIIHWKWTNGTNEWKKKTILRLRIAIESGIGNAIKILWNNDCWKQRSACKKNCYKVNEVCSKIVPITENNNMETFRCIRIVVDVTASQTIQWMFRACRTKCIYYLFGANKRRKRREKNLWSRKVRTRKPVRVATQFFFTIIAVAISTQTHHITSKRYILCCWQATPNDWNSTI